MRSWVGREKKVGRFTWLWSHCQRNSGSDVVILDRDDTKGRSLCQSSGKTCWSVIDDGFTC